MSVISIETRKANELAATSNISDSSIFMVHDGTGLKRITFEDVKRAMIYPNAGSHNSIYRGKNLGSTLTQAQYTAIRNGTFDDLFIGDYWVMGGINYRIAAFDYYYNTGDINCTSHHIVVVPDKCLYSAKMNDTATTQGGYVGSKMYRTELNRAKTIIKNAFNNHILNHRDYLSTAVFNNTVSNGGWFDSEVDLMTENMVYGGPLHMAISNTNGIAPIFRISNSQLPLFSHNHHLLSILEPWFLRDVVNDSTFATIYTHGNSSVNDANLDMGVRPYFCVY